MTPNPTPPDPVQTSAPVSPTGAPLLSPKLAPYLFVLTTACAVLAGASKINLGLPDVVFGWAMIGATLFGALLAATPGFRKAAPVVLLVLSLGLTSCAHPPPTLVITARSMQVLNDSFVGTAAAMDAALDAHHVTPSQYAKWADFGRRFQASGAIAEKLYDAAAASKDDSTRAHAEAVLRDFEGELAQYAALALQVVHPDGGP